ncbi:nuclear transport factor 2 family protein [Wukongibacter baidiensis]
MNNLYEVESVRRTMNLYIEGTKTGDVEKLKKVFHSEAIMSGNLMDKQMVCGTPQAFYDDIDGKIAPPEYDAQIVNIDITGEIASTTLVETGLLGINFVNYYHLQRIDGQWKIVSKLFTSIS